MKETKADLFDVALLGRHQVAAASATAVDYVVMVILVELASVAPPIATLLSATVGGMANFALARVWAFRSLHRGSMRDQAIRYAIACAGGALLNAGLLAAVLAIASPPYVIARAAVSVLVSIAYTYPMHARFVFQATSEEGG